MEADLDAVQAVLEEALAVEQVLAAGQAVVQAASAAADLEAPRAVLEEALAVAGLAAGYLTVAVALALGDWAAEEAAVPDSAVNVAALDWGRPALQAVRNSTTSSASPRMALVREVWGGPALVLAASADLELALAA